MSERLGMTQPYKHGELLECLLIVSKQYGVSVTAEKLVAGLPLVEQVLTPSIFVRAAKRAAFTAKVAQRDLASINSALFPAILLLDNNRACVIQSIDKTANKVNVIYPEFPDACVEIPLSELESEYTNRLFYLRPVEHLAFRAEDIARPTSGHWFWSIIRKYKYLYRDILLTAFFINIFALVAPLFVMNVYDRVVPNHATDTLWMLAIGVLIAFCADAVLRMMRTWFVDLAASRIDVVLSANLMEKILGMRLSERPESVGSFTSGLTSFDAVRSFVSSATIVALIDLPFVLLFLIVIFIIAWPLAVPILIAAILLLIVSAAVQKKMRDLSWSSMQASAQRSSILVESVQSLETLKTTGAEGKMQRLWESSTLLVSRVGVKMRFLAAGVTTLAQWLQQSTGVMILIIGVYLIIDGTLTQGALVACYLLSSRVMAPIAQASGLIMQYHAAATALLSLDQVMNKKVERPADANWISRPALEGNIEFSHVSFSYPKDERDVLRDVNFSVVAGERLVILGRNGSGKSTIEKLIAGLYVPTQGKVLIDGIDILQLDPAELRSQIGYVEQSSQLFFGSLKENILMANPLATDTQIVDVLRQVGLQEFVDQHPHGIMMSVGEGGQLLSGGQRQCVAVARALIKQPIILLMDEPTGAMDHSTEEEFKRNIAQFAKRRTLIMITHRTSLLELADRILVVDAGKVVADGPKDSVVEALRQGRIGRAQ